MSINIAPSFKSSVNIKFDIGNRGFFERYLPTPSHADALYGLLKGFNEPEAPKSHIIIGPYGTGKSLIGTILSSITSDTVSNDTVSVLQEKFNKVDDDIYDELKKVQNIDKTYLPIVLNGNEGRFRVTIISSIMKKLEEQGIEIVIPGVISKIISTVEKWESDYASTYQQFLDLLHAEGKDIQLWRLEILSSNIEEIDWFKSIFPELTSGTEFIVDYKEDFIEQIKTLLDELAKRNIGLFITYDEFGRFLQTLDNELIHETMQDLQDIAELADHYIDSLQILLITHKNLRQYFNLLKEEYKDEFGRIEKRFKNYHISNDQSTFVRLTHSILNELNIISPIDNKLRNEVINSLRKYSFFPTLNQVEIEKLIVEGSFPIHPIALYLLPHLSSVFGQNERTLFTFLESNETEGLLNHVQKNDGYYLPNQLFDYFFSDEQNLDNEDFKEIFKLYKQLVKKIPTKRDKRNLEQKILKLITLWELTGLQSTHKLNAELVAFALNSNLKKVEKSLEKLSNYKAIRYNRILGYWELFQGSSINVEEEIQLRLEETSIDTFKRKKVLNTALDKKFYIATSYNDKKSMTRFATTQFLLSTELIGDKALELNIDNDAVINFVVLEDINEKNDVIKEIFQRSEVDVIYAVSNYSIKTIEEKIDQLIVVDDMLNDVDLIKQDKDIKSEVLLTKEDLLYEIKEYINMWTEFSSEVTWLYKGQKISITSQIKLENKLSQIMGELYPFTPEVRNDSINRRQINNVQLKAGKAVVDHILKYPYEDQFKIEGNGPDYLIYATIFKNNNFSIVDLDNIEPYDFRKMRKALVKRVKSNNQGHLSDLLNILSSSPFGIRKPLTPIYLVALLRDVWDQIMFYRNDMYVPAIDGDKLYKMIDEPEEYKFVFYNFNKDLNPFLQKIDQHFGEYKSEYVEGKPRLIQMSSALIGWLRSLPKYTQVTSHMNDELNKLKATIKRSEVDPTSTIQDLFESYHNNFEQLIVQTKDIEEFIEKQMQLIKLLILSQTNCSSSVELFAWAESQSGVVKKQNVTVKSILATKGKSDWVNQFIFNYTGISIEDWSDTTFEMLSKQISSDVKSINQSNEANARELQIDGKNVTITTDVELSTKSKTIYKNVHRMINNAGRTIPRDEVEYIIYKLVQEFVE
ncbi:hypothetical protein [Thalassobacillus hwangdonensis]|uniref:ATP-binding protein n=1 Tax=Thalassobacillus hwangdonensis TaxID=546108 RepID=A0ABW3L4N8_9BACI